MVDAKKLLTGIRGLLRDLESNNGIVMSAANDIAVSGSRNAAMAASDTFKSSSGNLLRAIRQAWEVDRKNGNLSVTIQSEEKMDQLLGAETNKWTGTTYRSYWRLLLEGWGNQGDRSKLGYKLMAVIYDTQTSDVMYTSPFDPRALNYESTKIVTFRRHPGSAARNWLSMAKARVVLDASQKMETALQEALDKWL